jgi:hypothetical protein
MIAENDFFTFDSDGIHLFRNAFRGLIDSLACFYGGV